MSSRVVQIILNLVFIINSGTSADYMIEPFVSTSLVHSYVRMFRGNNMFIVPKVKFGKKAFACSGCYL